MTFEECRLSGGLGAEIVGFDFDRPPQTLTVHALRQALLRHGLLLFRGRTLEPVRQIAFTLLFGDVLQTCSARNRYLPHFPHIARVSNQNGQGLVNIGPYWHSDGAYLEEPTAVSIHHIIVPTVDGDTLYTDLAAAYERLSDEDKLRVAKAKTRNETGVLHPLAARHPVTARLGLYVNMGAGTCILDEAEQPDITLYHTICEHLNRQGTFYRHQWRPGDMIVVDNFAVAHHATPANPAALRILHRTSVHGPAVWWRKSPQPCAPVATPTAVRAS